METNLKFGKNSQLFLRIAAFSTAALAIINLYAYYRSNLWTPKIKIKNVDFTKGLATLDFKGKEIKLKGDSNYAISGEWGARLGKSAQNTYDRIEITKKGLVKTIIKESDILNKGAFANMVGGKNGEWINAKKFVGGSNLPQW